MSRLAGWIMVGVGGFLLVTALLLRFYAYDQVAVVPIDNTSTTVSQGEDMTYFDRGTLSEQQDTLTSTRQVIGNVEASEAAGDDIAVWDTSVISTNSADDKLSVTSSRLAFDRFTAEAVDCCDTTYDDEPVTYEGLYFKFPFNTQKDGDYTYWDDDLGAATPIVYDGTEDMGGLSTYRFVQTIEPTMVGTIEVPPSVLDEEGEAFIAADEYFGNVRTVWVEPETGVIIKGQEEQDVTLHYEGEERAVVTRGTIAYTDETVDDMVDEYGPLATQLKIVRVWGPLLGLIAGLLLIGFGVFFVARAERQGSDDDRAAAPDSA